MLRTKRRGLLRNAAIVLGNVGDERSLPALRTAMNDADEMVREAATWAVTRIAVQHPDTQTPTEEGRDDEQ